MQHQYWITKQTLSRKFGRKEDECIVSSDAQLDAKLELFRNIQTSCTLIQRIIDKYQESICCLAEETNSMGRFLKKHSEEDKTRAGDAMSAVGKSLVFCAQQQLLLHEPLMRFYQELETFRQRAIGDTLQNVIAMEKARTEYRAALSWMKNVSLQLDPDANKQLEKFKKVQDQVRRGKMTFDKLALDCLQKVDLLAAARCNMLNHSLSFYQNNFLTCTEKSAKTYSSVSKVFENKYGNRVSPEELHKATSADTKDNDSKKKSKKENKDSSNENTSLLIPDNDISPLDNTGVNELVTDFFEKMSDTSISKNSKSQNSAGLSSTDKDMSHDQEYYENLEKEFLSQYENSSSTDLLTNKTSYTDTPEMLWNPDDEDLFLPRSLLKQSLKSANDTSKPEKKNTRADNNKTEQGNKNHSAKSWLDLFEELDPLSNNQMQKSSKNKNSFV
ncbi:hypothetical protein TSAR_004074 [Trichomalopsis sarcophagae]|uniref:AH domain-containing protein n=1 Tax=Trichomalopsis sarcophagae TaxID=543379 RepID=A0A232EM58_9HYME|nr:hypothetical protein TSAR_004074 [Trichomalopsis sarcophagae]